MRRRTGKRGRQSWRSGFFARRSTRPALRRNGAEARVAARADALGRRSPLGPAQRARRRAVPPARGRDRGSRDLRGALPEAEERLAKAEAELERELKQGPLARLLDPDVEFDNGVELLPERDQAELRRRAAEAVGAGRRT